MEQYRRESTPDSALQAHAQLLGFRDFEQAAQFRQSVLNRFPDHAVLRVGLASQLEHFALYEEASELFGEALALQPDMPEARVGVARRKMAAGDLDEARRLLDFLETPGAGQKHALGPLDVLSGYYQRQGRHEEALSLARHLLQELPEAGQRHPFRSFVRKSEKALGRTASILPPIDRSLRGLFRGANSPFSPWQRRLLWTGLVVGLVAAGLFINNEYIRRHRTIHVVNACDQPVQIKVDDGPPTAVTGKGQLTLSEGRHRVQLSGPVEETVDLDVNAGFFDRWFKKPAWILNPGGEAVLDEMTLYYAAQPRPSEHRLIAGQPLVVRPQVDYPFETPPESLDVGSKNGEVVKTAFRWIQGQDQNAFLHLLGMDRKAALNFAEGRLRHRPTDVQLLRDYVEQAQAEDGSRIEAFLRSGLDHKPILVEWHRAYQSVCQYRGRDQRLTAFYDQLLAADSQNGALLYLRGRVDPDWTRRDELYRQSTQADPRLPWPWMALGAQAGSEGRWDEALRLLKKAQELGIDQESLGELPHVARLATGEARTLVNEYRPRLAANPMNLGVVIQLCDALAAAGQTEQILPEVTAWQNRLPGSFQPQLGAVMRATALYQAGKPGECEKLCRDVPSLANSSLRLQALLALKKGKEAAADQTFAKSWDDPWTALALSLELSLEGETAQAATWRERATERLTSAPSYDRQAASFLQSAQPPQAPQVLRLLIDAPAKALLYAVLAERFPARRFDYQSAAARFNILRKPPFLLVHRSLEKPISTKP